MTNRQKIAEYLSRHAGATAKEIVAATGVGSRAADNMLRRMVGCGELRRIGMVRGESGCLEYVYESRMPPEGRMILPCRNSPTPTPQPGRQPETIKKIAAAGRNSSKPTPPPSRGDLESAWMQQTKIQQEAKPKKLTL